jgi:hypothetical protein
VSSKPCVGCGWCCLHDPCWVSHWKHGHRRRCPELYWDKAAGRYFCRVMGDPVEGERARRKLFEGQGCCAPDNPWRDDLRERG